MASRTLIVFFVMALSLHLATCKLNRGELSAIALVCQVQTGANAADLAILANSGTPVTHEGNCLFGCILKRLGVFTADGQFSKDGYAALSSRAFGSEQERIDEARNFSEKCGDKVNQVSDSGDGCARAAEMVKCSNEINSSMDLIIEDYIDDGDDE